MKSILSEDFKYTSAAETDIRKLFQRIKREQKKSLSAKVIPIHAVVKQPIGKIDAVYASYFG